MVADRQDPADVFAFPDYQAPSRLQLPDLLNDDLFSCKAGLPGSESSKIEAPVPEDHGFFKLPTFLQPSANDERDALEPDHSSSPSLPALHKADLADLDVFDDNWLHNAEVKAEPTAELKTWDTFTDSKISTDKPLFLSEAGPAAYDAALASADDPLHLANGNYDVVQTNPYVAALIALVLGRGSLLFPWDQSKACFVPELQKSRVSGHSSQVLQGLQTQCLECGTTTRFLSAYVQRMYKTNLPPVRVAVAKAIDTLLYVIQTKFGSVASKAQSLIQLRSMVLPIHSILHYFKSLVIKASKSKSDERILSTIFGETQALEHGNTSLSDIMRLVLAKVSEPWLEFAEKWIGLKAEEGFPITKDGPGKSFVRVDTVDFVDDLGLELEDKEFVLDEAGLPGFIPSEIATSLFEAGVNLRLLRTHHPEHPLCQQGVLSTQPPTLHWCYDWDSIRAAQNDATEYGGRLLQYMNQPLSGRSEGDGISAVQRLTKPENAFSLYGYDESQLEIRLQSSIQRLDQAPAMNPTQDTLYDLLFSRLISSDAAQEPNDTDITPHWSLIPLYSFGPLISAQAQVINREYLHLIFKEHKLRDHLSMLKELQLLGNGVFCSRLSHALFDPDLETAERQAGVARNGGVMGLRLEERDTWPPASSELRLALMGVLVDSYLAASEESSPVTKGEDRNLPGDLSFAVRDLSPEDIEKCLDPNSLEALDFLRLAYRPPAPLAPIFPPVVRLKYDKIFKLLIRILRMLYVTGQFSQDIKTRIRREKAVSNVTHRFGLEARHFVSSVSAYFFEAGVESPWREFDAWLDKIEVRAGDTELDPKTARTPSPEEVREQLELMLDRMMSTMLLRKRQQPVMKLVEDIFSLVLKFAKQIRLETAGKRDLDESAAESHRDLYKTFRKKVGLLVTVCRGLSEREGHANRSKNDLTMDDLEKPNTSEENTMERFLTKLDMTSYYGNSRP